MKKRTVLLRLVPLAVVGAVLTTFATTASQAAIKPKDTVINGVSVRGYLMTTSEYYSDMHDEPPRSEQWSDAWLNCKIRLGDNAGQLRSVKRVRADYHSGGDGWWNIDFACSAAERP